MIGMQAKASSEQQTLQQQPQSNSLGASVSAAATTFYEHSIAEESSSSSDDENETFERTLEDDTSLESLIPSDSENEDYDEDGMTSADGSDNSQENATSNAVVPSVPYNYYQFPYYGSALARPTAGITSTTSITPTTGSSGTTSNAAARVTNTNNSNSTTAGITGVSTVDNNTINKSSSRNKLPVSSSANESTEPDDNSNSRQKVAAAVAAVSLEQQRQYSLSMVYSDDSGEREHKHVVRNPSTECYEESEDEDEEFTVYWQRWLMLFYMSMLNLLSDWTCYSVAPISVLTSQTFGKIEPTLLVTLFLSANAIATALEPMILSRFGLRGTIVLGSFLLLVGSLTKSGIPFLVSIIASQNQEWKVYLGFFLVGLSQPLYQCTPALLSNSWFPEKERTLATGVSLNANQLGIGCAFVFGTILVKTAQDIPRYFSLMSFLALLLFIGCLLQFDDAPPTPPSGSARIIRGTLTINLPKHFFRKAFGTDKNNNNNSDANKIATCDINTPPDSQLIPGPTTSITANLRQRGASSPSQQQDHPRHSSSYHPSKEEEDNDDDSGEEHDALWREEEDNNYQSNHTPPEPMYPSPYYWGYPTPPHVANYYGEQAASEQQHSYYSQPHQQPHFIHSNHNTFHHLAGGTPQLPYSPRFSDYYYEDDQQHQLHLPPTMYDYDEGAEPVEIVEPHKISIDIRDDQILLSAKACFNRKGFIHSCVAFVVSGIVINTLSTYMDYLVRLGGAGRVYVGIVGGSFQLIIMLSSLVVGKYADETRRYYTVGLGLLVLGAFALAESCVRLDEDEGANLRWTLLVVAALVGPLQPIATELGVDVAYPLSENTVLVIQQLFSNLLSALFIQFFDVCKDIGRTSNKDVEYYQRPQYTFSFYLLIVLHATGTVFFATFNGRYLRFEAEEAKKLERRGNAGERQPLLPGPPQQYLPSNSFANYGARQSNLL